MGIIPDAIIEQIYSTQVGRTVTPRNVHCDMRSREESTGIVKKKYKLLAKRNVDLGVYFFYALTTTKEACPQRARVELSEVDYESRDTSQLSGEVSYINIEKVAVENKENIIKKMRDSRNGFNRVGLIKQYKLVEIKSYESQIRYSPHVSDDARQLILGALSDSQITTDFINRFGI